MCPHQWQRVPWGGITYAGLTPGAKAWILADQQYGRREAVRMIPLRKDPRPIDAPKTLDWLAGEFSPTRSRENA